MPEQSLRGLFLKPTSRIFSGVWFSCRDVEVTVPIDIAEIPSDAGNTWVGLMGFEDLRNGFPVELTYQKGN